MQNVYGNTAVWVDAGGTAIDDARISKHERLLHGMIKKFLPRFALFEASMAHSDLANAGRLQIALALQKFDPVAALTLISKDESRKQRSDEEHMAWKKANPEAALVEMESKWVTRRLVNWLRRIRHEYSVKVRGGKSVSFTAMLAKANSTVDENGAENGLFGPREGAGIASASEDALSSGVENLPQARKDMDALLDVLVRRRRGVSKDQAETEATAAIAEIFRGLPEERQTDLVEYLLHRSATSSLLDLTDSEAEAS